MAWELEIVVRSTPKTGNQSAQNEDAAVVSRKLKRIAVADGASEGWGSGVWARAVATAYVQTPPKPELFAEWVHQSRTMAPLPAESAPWYAEEKQQLGAFATLLGLCFEPTAEGGIKWRAIGIGDTCLFHTRGNRLLTFPIESVHDFSNRPSLLGSSSESPFPQAEWFAGRAEIGDVFYVMTDAAAEWFLLQCQTGSPIPEVEQQLNPMRPTLEFADWVQSLRNNKQMRNDDTTIARVAVRVAVSSHAEEPRK